MKYKVFHQSAWEDYLYWLEQDKKVLKRINMIIKDIERSPYEGLGKPESLKHNLSGWWSRRITDEHRIVYRIKDEELHIVSLRYHYTK
ncbi:MAG: Txe/YoeB family addiction module toxin [Trueperaceae bacterium]|nr:Txe/YoeB family addiction module toxin [Trueperaceae bacterium]